MKRSILPFLVTASLLASYQIAQACCSLAPAHFANTRGLAAEVERDGKVYHLLGYQNSVENLKSSKSGASGNALFLPIPAKPGTMSSKSILDTSSCPHMLTDIQNAVMPISRGGGGKSKSMPASRPVEVFEHGIYTIVLAQDARDIQPALAKVPANKRPAMPAEIFSAYQRWYPGWTFALCCFDVKQETAAEPMLWAYQPLHPDRLFFPALDAHSGKAPNLDAEVDVDHLIFASSHRMKGGSVVRYSDRSISDEMKSWLPKTAIGGGYTQPMPNGDFVMMIDDVRKGTFRPKRVTPPFRS